MVCWVTTRAVAPGARLEMGFPLTNIALLSVTLIKPKVTLPVFCTKIS